MIRTNSGESEEDKAYRDRAIARIEDRKIKYDKVMESNRLSSTFTNPQQQLKSIDSMLKNNAVPTAAANWLANSPTAFKALDAVVHNPVTEKISAFGAGANPLMWNKALGEFVYGKDISAGTEELKQNNPYTAGAGKMATMLIPFARASQAAGKLPFMSKFSKDIIGKTAQGGIREGLAGIATGLGLGTYEGIGNMSAGDTAKHAAETAYEYGKGGFGLGGLMTGLGSALSTIAPKVKNFVVGRNASEGFDNFRNSQAPTSPNTPPIPNASINSPSTSQTAVQAPASSYNTNTATGATPKGAANATPTVDRIVDTPTATPKTFMQKVSGTYKNWFDDTNELNTFGKAAGDTTVHEAAINAKKVGGVSEHILNDSLVNPDGVRIGEGLKPIVKSIPKDKVSEFGDYLLHNHNVDRFREGKPIFSDYDSAASAKEVAKYEAANPEFKGVSDRLYKFINDFEDAWGKDTGLTTDKILTDLRNMYKKYVPTYREFSELENGGISNTGNAKGGYVNQPSTLRRATGSDRNVIDPIENIMNLVNRTVRTATRNTVGRELYRTIQANPKALSGFAEVLPDNYVDLAQYNHFNQGRTDLGNIVSVRVKGKPVNIRINKLELLEAVNGLNNSNLNAGALVKKTTTIFKGLITQYNPLFALGNIAKDIPTAYVSGTEKNIFKFANNLRKGLKGMSENSAEFQQYKGMGGENQNFFKPEEAASYKQDMISPKPWYKQPVKTILKPIAKFNNATETLPRFSEFRGSLARGATPQKALFNSGEATVNFSRGGSKAKTVDQYVPYFNASLQGLDRTARAFMSNPKAFLTKGLIGVTLPTTLMYMINKDNPNYQKLDNRTKDTYFLFPKEDGTFYKLPKSREIGVLFGSLFERMYRANGGDKNAFKDFVGTNVRTNFSPVNPIDNNLASPFINLRANKDFADRDIVPRYMLDDGRSKSLQYDEKTLGITKKIAEVASKAGIDISPKQMDYLIKSYTGVVGQLSMAKDPLKSIEMRFTADPAYSNQSVTDFYDNKTMLSQQATDKNITENIPSKTKTAEEAQRNSLDLASKYMSFIRKDTKNGDDAQKKQAQTQINNIAATINESIESGPKELKSIVSSLKPKGYK